MNIRPMKSGDTNFILSTWLKSYYDTLTTYSKKAQAKIAPPNEVFFKEHQEKIKKVLESANTLICTAPDDDNQIIGYIVTESGTLHFCYVKHVFRKFGVAKRLRLQVGKLENYSHHTPLSKYINKDLIFNPYKF